MNLFQIAFKSIKQRTVASSLTALSVALGVALMITILIANTMLTSTFSQSGIGYDLVVGPKGSDLDLVLNAIYRIKPPIENLPWRFLNDLKKDPNIELAVPLALGDKTEQGRFPILGTTVDYFKLEYGQNRKFRVDGEWPGQMWQSVIGSRVAQTNGWKIGTKFQMVHGGADGVTHDEQFEVVGILERTGTPNDRTVFVNINGFFAINGHEKPLDEAIAREAEFMIQTLEQIREFHAKDIAALAQHEAEMKTKTKDEQEHDHFPLIDLQKEVTSILLRMKSEPGKEILASTRALKFSNDLKEGFKAQAVNPVVPLRDLLDNMIGNVQKLLLILTGLVIIVSGISIFVSIYNSMSERKREIAIMRALGASRISVFSIILFETLILCVGGGLLGILLGHGLIIVGAPVIEQSTGLVLNTFAFEFYELYIIPGMIGLAILVGLLPAIFAYRTDVATNLSQQ
jgi:putative ABC transport system permease protein